MVEHLAQLVAEERRDDGGRRLVGSQPVGVCRAHDGGLEQSVVAVYRYQRVDYKGDKAQILFGRLSRCHKQNAGIRAERPVIVLARAVYSLEGLFVEQDTESVRTRHFPHQRHDKHVMVDSQIAFLEDGSQLELVRGHLIVAGLYRDAQFKRLDFQVLHEGCHACRDGSEVVVLELLVFRSLVSHKRPAGKQQVGAGGIQSFVYQEVFLFPSQIGHHLFYCRVEVVTDIDRRLVDRAQRLQQRGLVVERLARIGDEYGGNAQRVINHEHG